MSEKGKEQASTKRHVVGIPPANEAELKDAINYHLAHPGEVSSVEEANALVKEERRRSEENAVIRKAARNELVRKMKNERLDAFIFGKEQRVVITIDGERLLKQKGPGDLRCSKCGKPSGKILGRSREMAELLLGAPSDAVRPIRITTERCDQCGENFALMVQAVL